VELTWNHWNYWNIYGIIRNQGISLESVGIEESRAESVGIKESLRISKVIPNHVDQIPKWWTPRYYKIQKGKHLTKHVHFKIIHGSISDFPSYMYM